MSIPVFLDLNTAEETLSEYLGVEVQRFPLHRAEEVWGAFLSAGVSGVTISVMCQEDGYDVEVRDGLQAEIKRGLQTFEEVLGFISKNTLIFLDRQISSRKIQASRLRLRESLLVVPSK
jgi:hypothetical protein